MIQTSRGSILIFVLIASAVVMVTTTAFFNYFGSAVRSERFALAGAQAQALAEAGVDKAVYELNQSSGYSGETNTLLGNGSFTVSVATIDSITKRITVTSHVPSGIPTATKTIKATVGINSSVVSFRYGVQTGQGGVAMSNGSKIIGNLFSNGNVSGSGTITGDATVAVGVDPVADQQSLTQNSDYKIGDLATRVNVAQSFKPSGTATLAGMSLKLKKTGNPGDLSIKIVTDNAGKPSNTVLASGSIPASLVTGVYGFADVTLGSTPAVTANQTYWIIAIAPVSATNYFSWGLNTAGGYANGAPKYSSNWNLSNPTWTSITGDLSFMVYLSGIATSLSGISVGGNAWAQSLASCSITGNASYQTTSTCTVKGTKTSGVVPATPVPLPISDAQITEWEDTALAGGVIQGPYSYSGTQTLGPKKINGKLSVTNGAVLKLSGPLWVNGDVEFSNNASLLVDASTGTSGAMIIADATGNTATLGKVLLANNVTISGNGNPNSFPMVISTHVGSDAIDMSNNASSIILYAPYGTIEVSNGAVANQITANLLSLSNNSTISYVNGLQSTSFSNGPGGSWGVVPGTYTIVQ